MMPPLIGADWDFLGLDRNLRRIRGLIRRGQTEFTRVFSATRRYLSIRDPHLTEQVIWCRSQSFVASDEQRAQIGIVTNWGLYARIDRIAGAERRRIGD
jgi:hypothetical protein